MTLFFVSVIFLLRNVLRTLNGACMRTEDPSHVPRSAPHSSIPKPVKKRPACVMKKPAIVMKRPSRRP